MNQNMNNTNGIGAISRDVTRAVESKRLAAEAEVKERPPLARELDLLHEDVAKLGALVEHLETRLQPVLMPLCPDPGDNTKELRTPVSPMEEKVLEIRGYVARITKSTGMIYERVRC